MARSRSLNKKSSTTAPKKQSKTPEDKEEEPPAPKSEEKPRPTVSPRDPNHYRVVQLANGLEVILVSSCGYATELAEEELKEGEKDKKKNSCDGRQSESSVFNRQRTRRNRDANDEETSGKYRASKTNPNGTCVNTDEVKRFDEETTGGASGGSMMENMLGVAPAVKGNETKEQEGSWLPEEEPKGYLLERACQLMKNRAPRVEVAINVGSGSLNDTNGMNGISLLSRNILANKFTKPGTGFQSVVDDPFIHSHHTTLKFVGHVDNMEKNLQSLANELAKFSLPGKKIVDKEIDTIDRYEEELQCVSCWENPLTDWRRIAVLLSLAKEGHPIRKISPGYPPNLRHMETNNNLSRHLEAFTTQNYTAGNMTMAVLAPMPLDVMDRLVTNSFGGLSGDAPEPLTIGSPDESDPFDTEEFRKLHLVVCNNPHCCDKGDAFVTISFPLPPEFGENYKGKPMDYYSELLTYPGPGGLIAHLKDRNLGLDVKTSVGCHDTYGFGNNIYSSLFEVQITLDEKGGQNPDDVFKAVFSYLKYIKSSGPFLQFYDEMKKIRSIHFHSLQQEVNLEEPFPMNVSQLSRWLREYPSNELIVAPYLLHKFDDSAVQSLGELLKPERANFMLLACDIGIEEEETLEEQIFKTKFIGKEIANDKLEAFQNVGIEGDFRPPEPNPFLPEEQAQFCMVKIVSKDILLYKPKDKAMPYKIWYQQDDERHHFAVYNVHLVTPEAFKEPLNYVFMNVWSLMLEETLLPVFHAANQAGIQCSLKPTHYGIIISVYSWNHKLAEVLNVILKEIADFGHQKPQEELFEKTKRGLLKSMAAWFTHEHLSNHVVSKDIYQTMTETDRWTTVELRDELQPSTYFEFVNFFTGFRQTCNFVGIIRGNIVAENAATLCESIATLFPYTARQTTPFESFNRRVNLLDHGERIFQMKTLGDDTTENNVFSYHQIARQNVQSRVIADIVHHLLKPYIADRSVDYQATENKRAPSKGVNKSQDAKKWFNMTSALHDHQGVITLAIEACGSIPAYDVEKMDTTITNTLKEFYHDELRKLTTKDLNEVKNRVKKTYANAEHDEWFGYNKLLGIMNHLYEALKDLTCRWTDPACKSEQLKALTIEDIQQWYKEHLLDCGVNYRHLSIRILGNKPTRDKPIVPEETLEEWRERRQTIRDCAFNYHHKLMHAHKTEVLEAFSLEPLGDSDEMDCDDDLYIMSIPNYKVKLHRFPYTLEHF